MTAVSEPAESTTCIGFVDGPGGSQGPWCPDRSFAWLVVRCEAGEVFEGPVCREHWRTALSGTRDVSGHPMWIESDTPMEEA